MQVQVTFEFEEVHSNSKQAKQILETILESLEQMRIAFDADNCWVEYKQDAGE